MARKLKGSIEEPKIAVTSDRSTAIARSLLHITPIGVSLGVLQLSFRTVYWGDVGNSTTQNAALSMLQFAAKIHEIFIIASLSEIVLHRIQYELNGEGIPFGLLASGYLVSSITYLWSWQFWAGLFNSDLRQTYRTRLTLFTLIILATLLAALAGPSSAIAILPRLDWWESWPSKMGSTTTYIANSLELWPSNLTSDHFLTVDCPSLEAAGNEYCPNAGWPTIAAWDNNWSTRKRLFNITMPIVNSNRVRYLASSNDLLHFLRRPKDRGTPIYVRVGYALASSVSEVVARDLSCVYERANDLDLLEPMSRPIYTVSRPDGGKLFKPFVSVQCRDYDELDWENMYFPHDDLIIPPMNELIGQRWRVPDNAWKPLVKTPGMIKASWVEFSSNPHNPSAGVVFFFRKGMSLRGRHSVLVPCTVDARWVPVRMWLDPRVDDSIHEDQDSLLDPTYLGNPPAFPLAVSGAQRITFHKSWIDALAASPNIDNQTALEMMIEKHLTRLEESIYLVIISSVLSLYIADTLSRAQSAVTRHSFSNQNFNSSTDMCNSFGFEPFPQGSNASGQGWTMLKYSTIRFGYGWGFKGYAIKIATTVLLLNIMMCLIHVISLLSGGWTSSIMKNINEAIALAMSSNTTEKLRNTCAGISKLSTWKKVVKAREVKKNNIELVFEDGSDEEEIGIALVPGKRYGNFSKRRHLQRQ